MMLDGPYLAKLINQPTQFQATPVIPGAAWKNAIGFDYIALNTEWSAAGNSIIGFAGDATALGIVNGLPLLDTPAIPGSIFSSTNGTIPSLDIDVQVNAWFNTATRTYWGSFDIMLGAVPFDTNIGMVIASGTPS
jgi:hypothetical protein